MDEVFVEIDNAWMANLRAGWMNDRLVKLSNEWNVWINRLIGK